jgi:hypothetical protein
MARNLGTALLLGAGISLAGAAAAAPLLRCGSTVAGTLAAGEADVYSFAAEAGDAVRIHAAGAALPSVALFAPDQEAVSPDDPLPQSGVYTVEVTGSAAGAYGLTLEAVGGSSNGGGNGWPPLACGSNVPDGSLMIACGQTRAGTLDVAGDSDTFTFLAEAGDVVTIAVSDGVSGFDPVAELFAPGGAVLALSGESQCGPNESCSSAPIPAAGTYTIRVRQPNGSAVGAYSVRADRSPCASDCEDGVDNDGDGLIDFPEDRGCSHADDLSERRECNDGFDNDGDGLTDFAGGDVGCPANNSTVEDAQCDDGRDNDLDGTIDADGGGTGLPDDYCAGDPSRSLEGPATGPAAGCGLGPELALLGPLLAMRRARARRPAARR